MMDSLFPNDLVTGIGTITLSGIYLITTIFGVAILTFCVWYIICLCRVLYYMPRCIRWFTKPFWGKRMWHWPAMFCWFAWYLANLETVRFYGYGFTIRVDRGKLTVTRNTGPGSVGDFIPASSEARP